MNNNNDIHLHAGDTFQDGHKPGIIRLKGKNEGIASVNLYMEPEHLEQLRDTCQRQIDAIRRATLAESIRTSESQWIQGRADDRKPADFLGLNAPAEELAAAYIHGPEGPVEGVEVLLDRTENAALLSAAPPDAERVIVLDDTPDVPF